MRLIDADALKDDFCAMKFPTDRINVIELIDNQPTIAEQKHGRWIECDYKHLEHGMIETEPNAGLCCSVCRTGFKKSKMTFKQYCPACGARMDGGVENG